MEPSMNEAYRRLLVDYRRLQEENVGLHKELATLKASLIPKPVVAKKPAPAKKAARR